MYILANGWFSVLIREFFFSIDKIVFNFISQIYDLLITIARTSILSQADILDMSERIYSLLTVFMIFKVTLSLITYVVNPDDFSDKSKGVSKLGTNIIISLGLLILTPYIFNYAYQLQTIILEDNSLATLIFGDKAKDGFLTSAGDDMAYMTMAPFYTPNVAITNLANCVNLTKREKKGEEYVTVFNQECSGLGPAPKYAELDENNDYTMSHLVEDSKDVTKTDLANYVAGVENNHLGLMFREELATARTENKEYYIMDYKYIFSTVVGVVVCLLLITFCMDVGIRSIKLAFLQLIAPIPILSYVDPKSGKDGLFKKWYGMCFKTYLSLFIRLLTIYFAVYIISLVADMQLVDIIDGTYVTNRLVAIFIMIGALMFAKQLPKMLEGLGIKLDGDGKFTLNPLKKIENEALGGKQIRNAVRGVGGLALGAGIGTLGALSGAGAMRGLSGAFGGMRAGFQGKKLEEIRKAQIQQNSKMRQAIADGSRFGGRIGAGISSYLGLPTASYDDKNTIAGYDAKIAKVEQRVEPLKRKQAVLKEIADTKGAALKRAQQKIVTENAKPMFTDLQNQIRAKQARVDSIKSATVDINDKAAFEAHQAELAAAEADLAQTTFKNQKEYVNRNLAAAEARRTGQEYFEYTDAEGKLKKIKVDGSDGNGFEIDAAITDIQENINHLISKDEIQEINAERENDGYTADGETFESVTSFGDISNLSDIATDESRLLEVGEDHVDNVKVSKSGSKRTAPTESVRNLNREKENLQQSKRDLQTSDEYKQHQADDSTIK